MKAELKVYSVLLLKLLVTVEVGIKFGEELFVEFNSWASLPAAAAGASLFVLSVFDKVFLVFVLVSVTMGVCLFNLSVIRALRKG